MLESADKDGKPESGPARKEIERRASATTAAALPEILRAWRDAARARTGLALEVEHDEEAGALRVHDRDELYPTRDVIAATRRGHSGGMWAVRRLGADGRWRDMLDDDGKTALWADPLDAAAEFFDELIDIYADLRRAHIEGLAR